MVIKPEFDCTPMAGEPYFTLLARDPLFSTLIDIWIAKREADLRNGVLPPSDFDKVTNAKIIAATGAEWRRKNNGAWRKSNVQALPAQAVAPDTRQEIEKSRITSVVPPTVNPVQTVTMQVPKDIFVAISSAAAKVSVNMAPMLAFAQIESAFNPRAMSKGSTAAGLYQFTHDTWTELVARFGHAYSITPVMILDPVANATIMAERMRQYTTYLLQHAIVVDAGNMYCLHFLGMLGGVKLMLAAKGASIPYKPNDPASVLFPIAAAANAMVFGDRSLQELYNYLHDHTQRLADAFAAEYPRAPFVATATA